MSKELIAALLGAIVAGIIGGLCSYLLLSHQMRMMKEADIEKENRQAETRKVYFSEALLFDLEQSINLYDRIKSDYDKTKTIWIEYLQELREYRQNYERFQENTLQFSEPLRKKIFNYYAKTKWLINFLEHNQVRLTHNKHDELLESYIKVKLDELIGFKLEAIQIMQMIKDEVYPG